MDVPDRPTRNRTVLPREARSKKVEQLDYGSASEDGHASGDARVLPRKRSGSPIQPPTLPPRTRCKKECDNPDTGNEAEAVRRDRSPELIVSVLGVTPEDAIRALSSVEDVRPRNPIDYSAIDVPIGDPPAEMSSVVSAVVDAPNAEVWTTSVDINRPAIVSSDLSEEWLLDPAITSQSGMLVVVQGSTGNRGGNRWHGGDYEGARGLVLSVHNTGIGNEYFPSTARVKFLSPLNPTVDTFVIPVSIILPVQPDAVEQHALIIGGEHKGHRARLLEEVSDGWYVAAAYDYFEVACQDLVRLLVRTS
ncbi:hypothetical protein OH77DRAFT_1428412 [Trametes cingulata]|nr:hypothetical protein OH77DRAFT_1428412 [Trametes cingulata]